jgi:serine phosphatase RsbU (regulator of sigma subunit)
MPFTTPGPPAFLPGFDFFAALFLYQGEAVGGDAIFTERSRADGKFLFLMVDVAGHGQQAAGIVALIRNQFLSDPICENLSPGRLLGLVNTLLIQAFRALGIDDRFVAALAILVDPGGALVASNAGQPAPWIGTPGALWSAWNVPGGPVLGAFHQPAGYPEGLAALQVGQQLLAFTDGVTEAGRSRGARFQFGAPAVFLAGLPAGLSAGELVVWLLQALQVHAGPPWPEDDTTLCCLRRG